jgi:hypothetical protein
MQEFITIVNKHFRNKRSSLSNLEFERNPLHELAKELEKIIGNSDPDIIYTQHYGDLNRVSSS